MTTAKAKPSTKIQLLIAALIGTSLVLSIHNVAADDNSKVKQIKKRKAPIKTLILSKSLSLFSQTKNIEETEKTAEKATTSTAEKKPIAPKVEKTVVDEQFKTPEPPNKPKKSLVKETINEIIKDTFNPTVAKPKPVFTPRQTQCQSVVFNEHKPISIEDVLLKSFCNNPVISQAIASIQESEYGIELAEAAFRPNVSANTEYATNRIPSNNSGAGSSTRSITTSLNLSWVLFDFGTRNASLKAARQTLSAAIATQNATTLDTLIETLRIYSEALTAYSNLQALMNAEQVAQKSMDIVEAQYRAGIVGLSEKVQAKTALARASLESSQAYGVWLSSRGQLAVELDLPVQTNIKLADSDLFFTTDHPTPSGMELINEAKKLHPRIIAARAEIESLKHTMTSINKQYDGSVSFNGSAARTQSYNDGGDSLGENTVGISVQANIPLFTRKERQAREGQVQAQIKSRFALIEQIENELSNDIWRNAIDVKTTRANLAAAKRLLSAANRNYDVAFGRYKSGVGSISDLLLAQTALSNAQQELQSAKIGHFQSRMRLSMAVGRL